MAENSNPREVERIIAEKKERLKELACINRTTQILKEGKSLSETFQQIVQILPRAWQYPERTVARIRYAGKEYLSQNFRKTGWCQQQIFQTVDREEGMIEVYYLRKFKEFDEGPFLKEERDLIINLASILSNYIDSLEAREILQLSKEKIKDKSEKSEFQTPTLSSRQLLQKFLNKQNANRDIFHDLMPYRVKEILLVATLYDAYAIEKEGHFSEYILGEYRQLNQTSMPRVTGVSTYKEALEQLNSKHFDLVILMISSDWHTHIQIGTRVKKDFPYIPIYVLLNNNLEITRFKEHSNHLDIIDRIFVWNGDSKIFSAMILQLEDKVNVENDTNIGMVKVILLVEDSEKYYSRYLPLLYSNVMEHTERIIEDVSSDDLLKVLRMRARPKILLATTYEQAIDIFNQYKEHLLCLITDVKYPRVGAMDEEAGFGLVRQIRKQIRGLPTVIQSSDVQNSHRAFELKSIFINKNSETLIQDIESFIKHHLGFGNFVYKDASGKTIAEARTLKEFENHIDTIPEESLVYHANRNHFTLWLMARGEIKIAKMIHPIQVSDFKTTLEFRNYLKDVIGKHRNDANIGQIINFEENAILDEKNIVSMGTGALGGKGRGLAFVNTLIYNLNFSEIIPGIQIRTPITSVIGTDEFDLFMERNKLNDQVHSGIDYQEIKQKFLEGDLSYGLEKKLRTLVKNVKTPLAIRSSSLLEDSNTHPFSGVFDTYLLPNNHAEFKVRLKQAIDAIKLVYASIFSNHARSYFEAINFRVDDEKMAVVIQEVVGNPFNGYYYPHISGTAQSYNFYPVAHMEPEDGYAVSALGLGQYVVGGYKAYRFSPKYPDLENYTPQEQIKGSQVFFYAINMEKEDPELLRLGQDAGLIRLEINEAERHGTLNHCASVYNYDNQKVTPGLDASGPRIINFADILKFEYIPMAKTIELILNVVKEALGAPVEIEYAVDLNRDEQGRASFYLLQLKPLAGSMDDFEINMELIDRDRILLYAERSMGNGTVEDIRDVVFIKSEKFNKTRTQEIIPEIEALNAEMVKKDKKYVLIGPGRWGTRDRFIGIPLVWPQISNARVIVEISLPEFPLDASLGSHFFHNLTSMNVGYLSVKHDSDTDYIDWEKLKMQKVISDKEYITHIEFEEPLTIVMDGKKRTSLITWNNHISGE
ncbi:MAG: pyruvate, phosphate dikinase [Bacteroidales bacterium]|nr:pyruvate, phosphate dikinase [Bacteroidales bacterium]